MKFTLFFIGVLCLFVSCKNEKGQMEENVPGKAEKVTFFPVTDFIKGQISEIKNGGINTLKIVTSKNKTDSLWLKMERLDEEFKEFLSPEIDSTNLTSLFVETKFFDQTLDAITLSYDPLKLLPDSFELRHWDVYIDPNKGRVKRIYLLKKLRNGITEQLAWTAGKGCTITVLKDSAEGKYSVREKLSFQWAF